MDRSSGDKCSYVCPQTWLNQARRNITLSPTMGFFMFLNENEFGLFCNFGIIVVRSVFYRRLFQGRKKDIPGKALMF